VVRRTNSSLVGAGRDRPIDAIVAQSPSRHATHDVGRQSTGTAALASAYATGSVRDRPCGTANLSATINGTSWSGTVEAAATRTVADGDTIVAIGGANSDESIIIGMAFNDLGPGVYGIGAEGEAANADVNEGTATWEAAITGGTGSITIDTISATRVVGSFQYTAVPVSGSTATGSVTVTNGKFALSF
jgi:Family of unknown function (DUF6252)